MYVVIFHGFYSNYTCRSTAVRCLNPLEGQLMHRIYPICHQEGANLTHPEIIERTERFFYVSLYVIGFTTITESLQDFTKEVSLQFRWPSSDGTVLRRHCLNAFVSVCVNLFDTRAQFKIILMDMAIPFEDN